MPKIASSTGPPLLVFAAEDRGTMKDLLPGIFQQKGRQEPAGVFMRSPTGQLVVMRADLTRDGDFGLVYHEYFHFVVAEAGLRLPSWLGEGLADYWGGGARLTSDHAEIGRPLPYRLAVLEGGRRLLPMEEFLAAGRDSPLYHDQDNSPYFYGQAWTLTHMLISDEELQKGFFQYLVLIERGTDSVEAAKRVFGDLGELESKLRTYAKRPGLPFARLPLPPKPDIDAFPVREMPLAEVAGLVARHLPSGRTVEEMTELLDLASSDPASSDQASSGPASSDRDKGGATAVPATVHEARGQMLLRQGDSAGSLAAFEKALESPNPSAMTPYAVATLRLGEASGPGESPSPEVATMAEKLLLRSIEIDPRFAPAHATLAQLYAEMDGRADDALAAIRRAAGFSPNAAGLKLKEAEILKKMGRARDSFLTARGVAEKAMATGNASRCNSVCWQGSLLGLAELVLPACEKAVELAPDSASHLDSRAVARALLGDLGGALSDFRAALDAAEDGEFSPSLEAKRRSWIVQLEKGESPFAEKGHRHLAEDPEEAGSGWIGLD